MNYLNFCHILNIKKLLFLSQVLRHVQTGHRCPLHPLCQCLPLYAHEGGPVFPVSSCEQECGWRPGGASTDCFILKGTSWTSCWTPRLGCWSSGWLWNWCPNWWNTNSGASLCLENTVSVVLRVSTGGRRRPTGGQIRDQFKKLQLWSWRDSQFIPHQLSWDIFDPSL